VQTTVVAERYCDITSRSCTSERRYMVRLFKVRTESDNDKAIGKVSLKRVTQGRIREEIYKTKG
jgi:hypothetical protein